MIDAPVDAVTAMPVRRAPAGGPGGASFSQALQDAARGRDRAAARDAATQLVSSVFVMPVLASLHDSPFLEPPFAATYAEKQFQPLLDRHLADRITGGANFPLVDVIVDRLLGPARPPAAAGERHGESS